MKPIALLDADPDLGASVPATEREAARRACLAPSVRLPRGDWEGWERTDPGGDLRGFGLLALDGVLCRRVAQGERCGAELIGPGDLMRPWDQVAEWSTLPTEARWSVIRPASIAILDRRFSRHAAPFPGVAEALVRRAMLRSRYLAILAAIVSQRRLETRLHMLFWHLADRFGRMRGEWVQIPVPLTHSLLAELVAARRPSVSTALIGQPPPSSSEIWRPSEARPSRIPGERIEPTAAGIAPVALAALTARVRPAPPGGERHPKRQQGVASANASQ